MFSDCFVELCVFNPGAGQIRKRTGRQLPGAQTGITGERCRDDRVQALSGFESAHAHDAIKIGRNVSERVPHVVQVRTGRGSCKELAAFSPGRI